MRLGRNLVLWPGDAQVMGTIILLTPRLLVILIELIPERGGRACTVGRRNFDGYPSLRQSCMPVCRLLLRLPLRWELPRWCAVILLCSRTTHRVG